MTLKVKISSYTLLWLACRYWDNLFIFNTVLWAEAIKIQNLLSATKTSRSQFFGVITIKIPLYYPPIKSYNIDILTRRNRFHVNEAGKEIVALLAGGLSLNHVICVVVCRWIKTPFILRISSTAFRQQFCLNQGGFSSRETFHLIVNQLFFQTIIVNWHGFEREEWSWVERRSMK